MTDLSLGKLTLDLWHSHTLTNCVQLTNTCGRANPERPGPPEMGLMEGHIWTKKKKTYGEILFQCTLHYVALILAFFFLAVLAPVTNTDGIVSLCRTLFFIRFPLLFFSIPPYFLRHPLLFLCWKKTELLISSVV